MPLSEEDAVAEEGEACSSVHLAGDPLGKAGDAYTPAAGDVVVEVVAGKTRHSVVFPVKFFCSVSWSS